VESEAEAAERKYPISDNEHYEGREKNPNVS
jgi:hypothetical protein